MSVDGNLVAEAERLLRHFTGPARALVEDNKYGPLEARLAGGLVKLARKRETVVVSEAISAEDQVAAVESEARGHIEELIVRLEQALEILADRCVGVDELLVDAFTTITAARAEFLDDDQPVVPASDPVLVENAVSPVR